MEIRHLITFLAIVETRSYTGAASKLGYTQSRLSMKSEVSYLRMKKEFKADSFRQRTNTFSRRFTFYPRSNKEYTKHSRSQGSIKSGCTRVLNDF